MDDTGQNDNAIDLHKDLWHHALLDNVAEGVVVTDTAGRIKLISSTARKLLQLCDEDVANKLWGQDLPVVQDKYGNPIDQSTTASRTAIAEAQEADRVYFFLRPDGTRIPVRSIASPIIIDGQTVGVVNIFRDISEEVQMDAAKSEFLEVASHHLRSPLSTLKWNVELLSKTDTENLSEKQLKYLSAIKSSARSMNELINSLLNMTKLELGTWANRPEKVNLQTIYQSCLQNLQELISSKQIEMQLDVPDLAPISANIDQGLVTIIFQSILDNAVRYSRPNGVVKTSCALQNGELTITISDNGIGIPESDKDKIFQRTFRASNVPQDYHASSGLSLYITKTIVENVLHGKIWFESEEGQGTAMHIALPEVVSTPVTN